MNITRHELQEALELSLVDVTGVTDEEKAALRETAATTDHFLLDNFGTLDCGCLVGQTLECRSGPAGQVGFAVDHNVRAAIDVAPYRTFLSDDPEAKVAVID
jgi:hypothetical protein